MRKNKFGAGLVMVGAVFFGISASVAEAQKAPELATSIRGASQCHPSENVEPVDIHRLSAQEVVIDIVEPNLEFLQVSSRLERGGFTESASIKDRAFIFVDAASGEALPSGYVDRKSTAALSFRPDRAEALEDGNYCDVTTVTSLGGAIDDVPYAQKRVDCFEVVAGARSPLSLGEYSKRVTPMTLEYNANGQLELYVDGTRSIKRPTQGAAPPHTGQPGK